MGSKEAVEKVAEAEEEECAASDQPPVTELHHIPKDPRTNCKARWNVFSRLLFM